MAPEVELPSDPHASEREESSRIREILKPPPILEVEDWGIPPEGSGICNPALQVCLKTFTSMSTYLPFSADEIGAILFAQTGFVKSKAF